MYFTAKQIVNSINALSVVHPFHGITFLACKKAALPVGHPIVFPLDSETDQFLKRHHRIDPGSDWFFQPFKSSDKNKKWVRHDYSAKGLQAVNTQTFKDAFLHEHNSRIWGWSLNYVDTLAEKLTKRQKIPAFDLAVWLFRDLEWPASVNIIFVLNKLISEYSITSEEQSKLFAFPEASISLDNIFQQEKVEWKDIRSLIQSAPDAQPDQGGTLSYLETRGIGPANSFVFEPASRLSLITGDNGLGKSFLLEVAWWALTGTWAERPIYPSSQARNSSAEISFAIEGEQSRPEKKTIEFSWKSQSWPQPKGRPTIPGLIVYARVDGSFAIWDPARQVSPAQEFEKKVVFSSKEVWDGLPGRIEGLIRDWARWQNNPSNSPYEIFQKVLAKLSPPDLGQLKPGEVVRIPDDPRDIPTIVHPYGSTPIVYASAGVRRIITLAYLIVWAWHEHLVAVEMAQTSPQRRMVVLIDEMEAHLHPRWQRALLPALMDVCEMLSPSLKAQYVIATHSPLVMASSEEVFNLDTDKLFHLDIEPSGEVLLKSVPYERFGDVSSWLTSPVFELRHARSNEGESAIEAAKKLQLQEDVTQDQVREVTNRLSKALALSDRFWPRWIAFAERYGVQI